MEYGISIKETTEGLREQVYCRVQIHCNFAYRTDFDVHLLWIHIYYYNANQHRHPTS
jgi:hypothetical protein